MPTYDYECECGNVWEESQNITEPPVKQCPKCQKNTAKRLIGKTSFVLKGGGWAADSYSNKY
jgi:putative FmdB family regulatory protein